MTEADVTLLGRLLREVQATSFSPPYNAGMPTVCSNDRAGLCLGLSHQMANEYRRSTTHLIVNLKRGNEVWPHHTHEQCRNGAALTPPLESSRPAA